MGLMTRFGFRNAIWPLAEIVLFFVVVTPAYVIIPVEVGSWITSNIHCPDAAISNLKGWVAGRAPEVSTLQGLGYAATILNPLTWMVGLPVWASIPLGLGYPLLVMVWWLPPEDEANEVEVRAFGYFIVVAIALAAVVLQVRGHVLSYLIGTLR